MEREMILNMRDIMYFDYLMSGEIDRIKNPIKNETQYVKYMYMIERCMILGEEYGLFISFDNPGFPKCIHMIEIVFPTENDEIEILQENMDLLKVITESEGVIIDTDLKGNIRLDLYVKNIYEGR